MEAMLLRMLEYNSTPGVQEPVRRFLLSYRIMSDAFDASCRRAHSAEDAVECYFQFAKNQCAAAEALRENLRATLDADGTRGELAAMLRDGFTF